MVLIYWLCALAVIACLPATIAKNKGRSFWEWWFYAALLFPISLVHSLVMNKNLEGLEKQALSEGNRKCPFCAEMIKSEAVVCKHCQRDISPVSHSLSVDLTEAEPYKPFSIWYIPVIFAGLVFLFVVLGWFF